MKLTHTLRNCRTGILKSWGLEKFLGAKTFVEVLSVEEDGSLILQTNATVLKENADDIRSYGQLVYIKLINREQNLYINLKGKAAITFLDGGDDDKVYYLKVQIIAAEVFEKRQLDENVVELESTTKYTAPPTYADYGLVG